MKIIRSEAWPAVRKSCWEAWSGAGFNLLCGSRPAIRLLFICFHQRERNTGQKLSEWLELKRTSCLKLQDCYFYRTMGHCSREVQEQGAGTWERESNILSRENSHSLPDMQVGLQTPSNDSVQTWHSEQGFRLLYSAVIVSRLSPYSLTINMFYIDVRVHKTHVLCSSPHAIADSMSTPRPCVVLPCGYRWRKVLVPFSLFLSFHSELRLCSSALPRTESGSLRDLWQHLVTEPLGLQCLVNKQKKADPASTSQRGWNVSVLRL